MFFHLVQYQKVQKDMKHPEFASGSHAGILLMVSARANKKSPSL